MSDVLLALDGVHTHIGQYHILQGVDLAVPRGELTVLLGRNGAGKTTTLRTIMGLWRPSQGSITLVFAEQPLELRRWTVVDAQGLPTHVVLDGIETGVELDDELFVFRNRRFDPGRRSDR